MRKARTITNITKLAAVCALLSTAVGAPAAHAAPSATAASSCGNYRVSHTSCGLGARVLAHCHMNGSACREGGVTWRCHDVSGAARCVSGARSVYRAAPAPAHFQGVYLDTIPELEGSEVTRGEVTIDGTTYAHGIQMNIGWALDKAEASYKIPAGAHQFSAIVGNDDNQPDSLWEQIPVLFEVFVDGRRAAIAHAKGPGRETLPPVSVSGAGTLKLVAINVGDELGGTMVDWGEPEFN